MKKLKDKNSNAVIKFCIAVFVLLLTTCLFSCEKEVQVNLSDGPTQVVVQGAIENGVPPYVMLTKSVGYTSKIDLSTIQNSYLHDAKITVSDVNRSITLKEYSFDTTVKKVNYKFYIYTVDVNDPQSLSFLGQPNHFYKLSVEYNGKTYESLTQIPPLISLDSIWYAKPDQSVLDKTPDARNIFIKYKDPDTIGNAIRYFTSINNINGPFYTWINSVFDDQIINGSTVTYNLKVGFNRGNAPSVDSMGYAFVGDSVTVKWSSIDRGVFDFYRTFEYAITTVGSPFTSPINVKTNMTNGALGVWAGYGSTFSTIYIKD